MILDGPILASIRVDIPNDVDFSQYPFTLPIIQNLEVINFPTQVTFLVGENGSGKSTILEAIAARAGFGREGGSKNIHFNTADEKYGEEIRGLSKCMTLSWRKKTFDGYFFRAESFFNIANYLDEMKKDFGGRHAFTSYGGTSLHEQSHGESFLAFFKNRVGKGGFYVFDEPEAALSPQRQLSLMYIMHELCKDPQTQFVIATHSPILLAYPNSTIYSCDGEKLEKINYQDTKHYQITKNFLDNPAQYLKYLFND